MRRGVLDITGDLLASMDLGSWLPRAWRVVGSRPSPSPYVVRLVLETDSLDDGPDLDLVMTVDEGDSYRFIHLRDRHARPVGQRCFIGRDQSGHTYIVPVEKREAWEIWTAIPEENPDAWNAPDYARLVEGGLTFTDPQENGKPL
jgi:hypothetical protein